MSISRGILSATSGFRFAVWSTGNKSSSITLSNGNLTFSGSISGGSGIATIGKSSDKWYWEVLLTAVPNNSPKVGIANYTPVPASTSAIGFQSSGVGLAYGYRGNPAACFAGPSSGLTLGSGCIAPTVSQIYGFALDMNAGTCAVYINGTLRSTITGLTGTWYPACGSDGGSGAGVANFGASAFTYYVSSGVQAAGFNPGVYS